jgi:carbonic anhydrase
MKTKISLFSVVLGLLFLSACNTNTNKETEVAQTTDSSKQQLVETVLTEEAQSALTPDAVITSLKEGNERFINNDLTMRNYASQASQTATGGQYPEAIILSCVDSRVPVETVFDRGIGDMFVARVAGNFVNEDILGSMEFACKVSGSKVIVVLGHESCGAVKAAIDDVDLGNITPMIAKIKPAITNVADYEGEKTSKNPEFVHMVCESNVQNTINEIRIQSPILKEMEDNGEIKIVGAIYDLDTGKVTF